MKLEDLSNSDLLRLQANATEELRRRSVVRTRNNPLGDYTEWLVASRLNLSLAGNSSSGYDAISEAGIKYQIKGRRITPDNQSRMLSAIRNYDDNKFDWLVAVIFDWDFNVLNAYLVPHAAIEPYCPHRDHVNGRVVVMSGPITRDPRVIDIGSQFEDE